MIQIDMEMPNACAACRFYYPNHYPNMESDMCLAASAVYGRLIRMDILTGKPDWCPLLNAPWISVKDRPPEEEKLYLVFREEQPRMMVLEYNTEKKEFGWTDYPTCRWNKREGVTHWMPLPEPPKEEKC